MKRSVFDEYADGDDDDDDDDFVNPKRQNPGEWTRYFR